MTEQTGDYSNQRRDDALADIGSAWGAGHVGGSIGNPATGYGTTQGDPTQRNQPGLVPLLTEYHLRMLYRNNWLVARIVDALPEDMAKCDPQMTLFDGDPDAAQTLSQVYSTLGKKGDLDAGRGGAAYFEEATTWARLFGSAYLVGLFNGGDDPAEPIEDASDIRSLDGLVVMDCYQLKPEFSGMKSRLDPEFYTVQGIPEDGESLRIGQRIHASRVLAFHGHRIHRHDYLHNDCHHDSIVQRVWENLSDAHDVKASVRDGLRSFSIFKVMINNLAALLVEGDGNGLQRAMRQIIYNLRANKVFFADKAETEGKFDGRNFAGVRDNVAMFQDELTAATGIPWFKIWGRVGRAGLADDGGAERAAWMEDVRAHLQNDWLPNHYKLFSWIAASELGMVPDAWQIDYEPLYQQSKDDEAQTLDRTATALVKIATILRADGSPAINGDEVREMLRTGADLPTVLQQSEGRTDRREDATYQPPASARNNARRVLEWRREHGSAVKGMTSVGWARARQLASGRAVNRDTVARMSAFNRHRTNYDRARARQSRENGNPWEYAAIVAWLGWGGNSGIDWARRISQGRNDAEPMEVAGELLTEAEFEAMLTDDALEADANAFVEDAARGQFDA